MLPLYDALNANFVQFGIWYFDLRVDELMVPYYRRHLIKMFIKGKPIRFGYKLWVLCGYYLKICTGREISAATEPLGTRVINCMVQIALDNSTASAHDFFFDNFFTSYELIKVLSTKNIKATGTIRENQTAQAELSLKKNRGYFEYCSDGTVFIVRWNDNSVVSVASNCLTHEPVTTASRCVNGASNVQITLPHLIKYYNEGMGGVDLMDRLLSSYRPMIRGKKWWWLLFLIALNVSIVAAWHVHCASSDNKLSHLAFRRQAAICL